MNVFAFKQCHRSTNAIPEWCISLETGRECFGLTATKGRGPGFIADQISGQLRAACTIKSGGTFAILTSAPNVSAIVRFPR